MHYDRELSAALDAARRAGRLIMELYRSFELVADAPADISTEADRRAQDLLIEHLSGVFPGDAFCAEEQTPALAAACRSGDRLWVIDPIDGTRGFARKNGEFSVMVGFVHAGVAAVGVVLEPAKDRVTFASRGKGCFRADGSGEPAAQRCRVSDVSRLADCTLTQSHSRPGAPPAPATRAIGPANVIETYSAGIKLALVARGEADVYLNTYPKFHDWDVCAGHVLVAEAGGRVSGLRGEGYEYGRPGAAHSCGLLATNGNLHDAAVRALSNL